MNIYVGNLSYGMTESDLSQLFEEFGQVNKANIITDRETGRSKGFGFVEIEGDEAGQKAIELLQGKSIDGRDLTVSEARPREERPRNNQDRPRYNERGGRSQNRGGGGGGGGGGRDRDRGDRRNNNW